jgi:hypothetical protein
MAISSIYSLLYQATNYRTELPLSPLKLCASIFPRLLGICLLSFILTAALPSRIER